MYDVIVVGGGHAGYEAALAAARMGASTVLISIVGSSIGRMSCNPAIGGIAKSHIVCELDALGGEMARNTDYTGIQFRTLNTRKGAAVQAHRVQCDKNAFPARMLEVIRMQERCTVLQGMVTEVWVQNGRLMGVKLADGSTIPGKAVVLTPGTFLNGVVYVGATQFPAGRWDEDSADQLGGSLRSLGFSLERLKTGTPPRLHKDSLQYDKMEIQPGLTPPPFLSRAARTEWNTFHVEHSGQAEGASFHVEHPSVVRPWQPGSDQIPCYLTHTNERTHQIISDHLSESALYSGAITGTGVRYCPSIEDKIVKFSDKDSHHVFIEPEGRNNVRIYPNGTSNSLPEDVQVEMIHSIVGLEKAEFIRPGYGIEYDFVDPTQLTHTLETKRIEHLYCAGQLNGTTGYEEAAGQGFMAGVNAVLKLQGRPPLIIGRDEGYIGVLIDDLVTKGTNEPYRMFTSRAEYRLLLRQSNAPYRLKKYAELLGIQSSTIQEVVHREQQIIDGEVKRILNGHCGNRSMTACLLESGYAALPGAQSGLPLDVITEIETCVKYDGYIKRDMQRIERAKKMEAQRIPATIDYDSIKALRFEAREKLKQIQPQTIGQASRISGVNPPDLSILSIWIKKKSHLTA